MRMTSLSIKLSQRQIEHLRKVKVEHSISMAASIRNLIMRDIHGIGGRSEVRGSDSGKRTRPVQAGSSGYAACVAELSQVFAMRRERGGRG